MNFVQRLQTAFQDFWERVVAAIPNFLTALTIIVIFLVAATLVRLIMTRILSIKTRRRQLYIRVVQTVIVFVGVFLALGILGVNMTGLLTGLGLVTLGLSFALQDVLINFIAGLEILGQAPFELGDLIEVGEQRGIVREIGARVIVLEGQNGAHISIPNRDLLIKSVRVIGRKQNERLNLPLEIDRQQGLEVFTQKIKPRLEKLPGVMPGTLNIAVDEIRTTSLKLTVTLRLTRRHPPRDQLFYLAQQELAQVISTK